MKKIIALLLCTVASYAQDISALSIIKADTVFDFSQFKATLYPKDLKFGGISGLEKMGNQFYLVSDRRTPSPAMSAQDSWMYIMNDNLQITHALPFFGVKNVEAIRKDEANQRLWFTFEATDSTGIGYIDNQQKVHRLQQYVMFDEQLTFDNRGIEAIAAGQDLWYAFESGKDSTLFIKWPNFEQQKAETFKYPLDSRSCLSEAQILSGNLANGVTDILTFPNDPNKLLVMERCFNGKYAYIDLYQAEVAGNKLEKRKLFSWTPETTFQGKKIKPDNMEGMTWGDSINGKRTIHLISDDNHNSRHQRTILLQLIEE